MIWIVKPLLVLLLQAIFVLAFSQNKPIHFSHIDAKNGLSDRNVNAIIQDSMGFIWIASRDGLNKYDGYKMRIFRNNPDNPHSISSNYISDIAEDKKGNIWVATIGGGLNKYTPNTNRFTRYQHHENNPKSLSSSSINKILADDDGNIWVATQNDGLDCFNPDTEEAIHYRNKKDDDKSISGNSILTLYKDRQNNIWAGEQQKGLNLFDRKTRTFKRFINRKNDNQSISSDKISSIFEDSKHRLWVGTNDAGLNLYNAEKGSFTHFKHEKNNPKSLSGNNILTIAEDDYQNIWVGTENEGLSIFNSPENKFEIYRRDEVDESSLTSNSIYVVFKDKSGNMWVGTFGGGVNLQKKLGRTFTRYQHSLNPNSLSNNFVLSIFEDTDKQLWIGTDGGGLNAFDAKTGSFKAFKHHDSKNSISGDYILDIKEDAKKQLWIATWGSGINMYNKKTGRFISYRHDPKNNNSLSKDEVYAILPDTNGKIWIGTYGGGLDLLDPLTGKFTHFRYDINNPKSISTDRLNTLMKDSKGNLWIGTNDGGLNLFDSKTQSFVRFKHSPNKNSISNNTVVHMLEDHSGNIWLCTFDGLNLFDPINKRFRRFSTDDGLQNNLVYAILEDDHRNFWVSTNYGISRFNTKTNKFRNFTSEDGLQADEFKPHSALKSSTGELYFGGVNGFNKFFPDQIKENHSKAPLLLTGFQLFNEEVNPSADPKHPSILTQDISNTKSITLSHLQNTISFDFALLDFLSEGKKSYSYMLKGFDRDWNDIGSRNSAAFTNLPPGEYTFMVRFRDGDAQWSSNTLNVNLTIVPPFWATWWFISLAAVLSLLLIYLLYRLRLNSIIQKKVLLEKLVQKRTEEVSTQADALQTINRELQAKTEELKVQSEELTLQAHELRAKSLELEIQKEQEHLARTEADQANQTKSVFLASMSHEIRTPMNGVVGMASLLNETKLTEEQKDYLDYIIKSGENLLCVINDILDFSKIESGKLDIEQEDFNLRNCIEEVMDMFSQKSAKHGIDLNYDIDNLLPRYIIGDSLRLKQVLINLINNALKFTEKGEVFLSVLLDKQLEDGTFMIRFSIKDTGIGIPENKLQKLFKPFTQVDSSTTRKYGGTGLGLVICERIIHLMGGEVWVESQLGIGSTFNFTLQTIKSDKIYSEAPVQFPNLDLNDKQVLIVDDNHTNLIILNSQLKIWGLAPVTTCSGHDALDVLRGKHQIELVITDMDMPGMNGVAFAKEVKALYRNLPIIMLSSMGNEDITKDPGLFVAILSKPVKQKFLWKSIEKAFNKNQSNSLPDEFQAQVLCETFSKSYPMKILVAEDNLINQKLIERVLSKLGYDIEMADNGKQALEKLTAVNFDVILMDIQMPVMDGMEATILIRSNFSHQPYIVALTANAMPEERETYLKCGMNEYISDRKSVV